MFQAIMPLMLTKITVVLFALVLLLLGILLILVPWVNLSGVGDWGDNYLLALVVENTGLPIVKTIVASAWFRGAVTGLGVFNILLAFWEIANFRKSVEMLEGTGT
ncbi:MAG: hypothetical protein HKN25_07885 [Pyrinomonadaceae bacterium]|nr:hypothetical protein [Pyrinomonadaceae bacterium]